MTEIFHLKYLALISFLSVSFCSVGDNSAYFRKCLENCKIENCDAGQNVRNNYNPLSFDFSLWSCAENCEYECQWKTVEAFKRKNWSVPQFRGKWPFIRLFGLQEPASVIFSIINLIVNIKLANGFRKNASSTSPYFNVWVKFSWVQLNSWIWSVVYHTRDTDITEKLDYMAAFSVVLYSFYGVGLRYLGEFFTVKYYFWSVFCALLGLNHLAYLWFYNFDYGYNMALNCIIGGVTLILWILWSFSHFNSQPYVWKIFVFAVLMSATMLFELIDFPPIFWIFDAHSLWHACSVIVNAVFYMFITDDCNYSACLAEEKLLLGYKKN